MSRTGLYLTGRPSAHRALRAGTGCHQDLTLQARRESAPVPARDVMGTGYHAVVETGVGEGDAVAVIGLGPVGLCAVQAAFAAGADRVFAIDTVEERLSMAQSFGATPLHLTESDHGGKAGTESAREVKMPRPSASAPTQQKLACRLARKAGTVSATGVYAERIDLHMGSSPDQAELAGQRLTREREHVDPVLAAPPPLRLDFPSPLPDGARRRHRI